GWWFAYRFETTGLRPEERLLHLVLLRDRDGFRALAPEDAELLARLPAHEGQPGPPAAVSVAADQERALAAARGTVPRGAEGKSKAELDRQREQAHRYAEDCLLEHREAAEHARTAWEEARTSLAAAEEPTERARARAAAERAEREFRRKLAVVRREEELRYAAKDKALAALGGRARVSERRVLVGTAYLWLR